MSTAREQMRLLAKKRADRKKVESRLAEKSGVAVEEVKITPGAIGRRAAAKRTERDQRTAAEELPAPTYFNRRHSNPQRLWDSPAQPALDSTMDTPEVARPLAQREAAQYFSNS